MNFVSSAESAEHRRVASRLKRRNTPGKIEERFGTDRTVVRRFKLVRAGGAACGAALNASKMLVGVLNFRSAAAGCNHLLLLEPELLRKEQGVDQPRNCPIKLVPMDLSQNLLRHECHVLAFPEATRWREM